MGTKFRASCKNQSWLTKYIINSKTILGGVQYEVTVPAIIDRVAQTVILMNFEPLLEPIFHEDSYGYRSRKSAIDAIRVTRTRCWKMPWVLEFDIVGLFDNIDHELLMKAVRKHTDNKFITLYIERSIKADMVMPDGTKRKRTAGVPQGGCISGLLSNLFMHYAFDRWMVLENPNNPWVRYAVMRRYLTISQNISKYLCVS